MGDMPPLCWLDREKKNAFNATGRGQPALCPPRQRVFIECALPGIGHVRLLQTRGLIRQPYKFARLTFVNEVAGEGLSLAHGAQPCATWTLIDAPT
jgi:hypothetical protein